MKTKRTIQASIPTVEITINGTKHTLNRDEAKQLQAELAKAFPEPVTKIEHVPVYRDREVHRWFTQPMMLDHRPSREITCSQDAAAAVPHVRSGFLRIHG